ncbi:RNase H domain-containing protein [Trichonephila clavipes]|nr:RNase H domain-containing protein [Trichonephila clavipes]
MGLQFLFMDDNAPCHRTVAAEQLLESEDIERMDWPARSPDLNPIEHVWDFLGRRLAARTLPPVTIRELRLALQDEWAAMPQQLIDTLILSMGRRCETCLARKQVCFQWIPSHVGLPGNEAADELAGKGCDLLNLSSSVLSHSEIHSLHRAKMNLTWRNPPAHQWYAAKSPDLSLQCRSSRAHQTALVRFRSGPLRGMTFVQGIKSFFSCPCSSSGLLGHFPATVV